MDKEIKNWINVWLLLTFIPGSIFLLTVIPAAMFYKWSLSRTVQGFIICSLLVLLWSLIALVGIIGGYVLGQIVDSNSKAN